VPSERVRKMEIRANEAFDVYRELYYEGGVSSVYFWNLDDGFAGVVLLKKGLSISAFPLTNLGSVVCCCFCLDIKETKLMLEKWLRPRERVRGAGTRSTCLKLLIGRALHITNSPVR